MNFSTEQIARVCHEANREYCATIGDDSQPPWHAAPQWQKDSALNGVVKHLDTLNRGENPNPRESHEGWLAYKRQEGWTYGPYKDAIAKTHPCVLPYEELPPDQRVKDYIFVGIVKAFWEAVSVHQ